MDIPTKSNRKILVTQALPYANAPLHLGHILEAVQTDIWSRFQNLNGNQCYFFCADDNADVVATFSYGGKMPCIVRKNNVIGAQFHPEKSHSNGIKLIRNFALSK